MINVWSRINSKLSVVVGLLVVWHWAGCIRPALVYRISPGRITYCQQRSQHQVILPILQHRWWSGSEGRGNVCFVVTFDHFRLPSDLVRLPYQQRHTYEYRTFIPCLVGCSDKSTPIYQCDNIATVNGHWKCSLVSGPYSSHIHHHFITLNTLFRCCHL